MRCICSKINSKENKHRRQETILTHSCCQRALTEALETLLLALLPWHEIAFAHFLSVYFSVMASDSQRKESDSPSCGIQSLDPCGNLSNVSQQCIAENVRCNARSSLQIRERKCWQKIYCRAKNSESRRHQRQSGAAENRAAGLTALCCDVGLTLRHRRRHGQQSL